jgi:hypothetical protein
MIREVFSWKELNENGVDEPMHPLIRFVKFLSTPLLLLNAFGGILSGVWLIFLGRWEELGYGIVIIIVGVLLIGLWMSPGLIFAAPALYFKKKGNRVGLSVSAFLSVAYTMLVITVWGSVVLSFFLRRADSLVASIPLFMWSYGVAMGPLAFLAKHENGNKYTMCSFYFAQVAYFLVILVATVIRMSPLLALLIIGSVMTIAAVIQHRAAFERQTC